MHTRFWFRWTWFQAALKPLTYFFVWLCFNVVLIGVLGFNVFNRIGFFLTEKIIVFSLVNN